MLFGGKKKAEFHGWLIAAEQHIRQALEIYSGDCVRLEFLTMKIGHAYETECSLGVTGVVIGTKLADGSSQELEAKITLRRHSRKNGWVAAWNGFDLKLRKGEGHCWSRYCAFFDDACVTRGESTLPSVRVHQFGEDNLPITRDEKYRIGHHLGDRHLEEMPVAAFGRYAA